MLIPCVLAKVVSVFILFNFPGKMKKQYWCIVILLCFLSCALSVHSQAMSPDAAAMQALKTSLGNPSKLGWTDPDPCKWKQYVNCTNNRVTGINISGHGLTGSLPPDLKDLSELTILQVAKNQLTGHIPTLAGLTSLQEVDFSDNSFSSMPPDFFTKLTALQTVILDNNTFSPWQIPESLKDASSLGGFWAINASISGTIPDFFGGDTFPGLIDLRLAHNFLEGPIPSSFAKSSIQTLWLNEQTSTGTLNGSIVVLQNMTNLNQAWLHGNQFTGPIPDLSGLTSLRDLSLRDNQLTGIVPPSLVTLPMLTQVNLTNNLLQGPTPKFAPDVKVDNTGINSFCLTDPGVACDSQITDLLSIVESVGYPPVLARSWKGNDPCIAIQAWIGIGCEQGKVTIVNFKNSKLSGTISPNLSKLGSLKQVLLSNNALTGIIPNDLTTLSNLEKLDVSNNRLSGSVPNFRNGVTVITDGNPDIGISPIPFPPPSPSPLPSTSPPPLAPPPPPPVPLPPPFRSSPGTGTQS